MAALATISDDAIRLRNSVTEGMKLQAMAVGIPLALLPLLAQSSIPLGLGHNWAPALVVFPFIAVSYLTNAMFNLQVSVLYLRQKPQDHDLPNRAYRAVRRKRRFARAPLGLVGYGWAELVALLSYAVLHSYFTRHVACPSYSVAAIWFGTTACVLAVSSMRPPVLYIGFAVLLLPWLFPRERASMLGYARGLLPWLMA